MKVSLSTELVVIVLVLFKKFQPGSLEALISNPCRINQFRCSDGSRCLPTEKLCNSKRDCPEGEDERGNAQWDCTKKILSTQPCHPRKEFRCRFGGCVPRSVICDGKADCWGGTDESTDTCTKRPSRPPQTRPRPTQNPKPSPSSPQPEDPATYEVSEEDGEFGSPENPHKIQGHPCPTLKVSPSMGFRLSCKSAAGRSLGDCGSSPLAPGSTAMYRCAPFYRFGGLGSTTTIRTCNANGTWTPMRANFRCFPDCGLGGREHAALVTGGISSGRRGKWPWHVGIYLKEPSGWDLKCGGSLITPQAVLTAAHCVARKFTENPVPLGEVLVGLGKSERSLLEKEEPGSQSRGLRAVRIHPDYNHATLENDIALIFLDKPALIGDLVRPVCVPGEDKAADVYPGKKGYLVGWGRTSGGYFKEILQEAYIPVVDPARCKASEPTFATLVRPTTFCAGYRNGTSACDGDSGGGLVFLDSDTRRHFHVHGIVSGGVAKRGPGGGCEENYYAVFTRVANFHTWIERELDTYYQEQ